MNYKLIIAACILGLIFTQIFIYQYKRNPNEYTELNFVFIKKEGEKNDSYKIYFDEIVETEEKVFCYKDDFYTILDYSNGMFLLAKYPKKIKENEKFNFYFEITNNLGKEWNYKYYILLNENIVREDTITIKNKEKKLIREELQISSTGKNKVSIKLDTKEEIYFYIEVV
ncbi:MAG: hypothetical protein KAT49_03075 [Methanomicrobia archaeon]|nr:hypothetical protein [Methanomicrobia archaeon]